MSNYQQYESSMPKTKKDQQPIHPIWRGIGFALIILAPIMGYAAAVLLLEANAKNGWVPIPGDLLINWSDPYILIKIIIALVIAFLIFLVFQLITFFIYRVAGPSRYGPVDVPPVRYTGKKYKR